VDQNCRVVGACMQHVICLKYKNGKKEKANEKEEFK